MKNSDMFNVFTDYAARLQAVLAQADWSGVSRLAIDIETCWDSNRQLFFCGNGGSAANAIHLENDFLYGVGNKIKKGIRARSLSANSAVMTCLANDVSYDRIYSEQLYVHAERDDILVVLSGSGNSKNIIEVLKRAKMMAVKSYAILGFDGGLAKSLADVAIHFPVNDMQIAEDMQLLVGHMLMQHLSKQVLVDKKSISG